MIENGERIASYKNTHQNKKKYMHAANTLIQNKRSDTIHFVVLTIKKLLKRKIILAAAM